MAVFVEFIEGHTRTVYVEEGKEISLLTGKKDFLEYINTFIKSSFYPVNGILISGESGLGKSALLTDIQTVKRQKKGGYFTFRPFSQFNQSEESSKIATMLKIWIFQGFWKGDLLEFLHKMESIADLSLTKTFGQLYPDIKIFCPLCCKYRRLWEFAR